MSTTQLIHTAGLAITAALLLGGSSGCSSTGSKSDETPATELRDGTEVEWIGPTEAVPYDPETLKDKRNAGLVIAEIDKSLRAWNNFVLDGKPSNDLTRLDLLETTMRRQVQKYHTLLVDQLQTGPLVNRQVAAAALGFSDDPRALGPLLGALQDANEDVVANALLGLSTLGSPKTEVGSIASLFSDQDKPLNVRSNAGRALRSLRLSGIEGASRDQVIDAARLALGDEEASVRVHGSLILAAVVDTEAIQRLTLLLTDESPLVARAASRSIARIGSIDDSLKGRAARSLTASIDRVDRKAVRKALLDDLQRMAQVNYGDDTDAWLKYAHNLP